MNTSLGISFFRTVNEEGSNGWAQVYARIPFDDYELAEKGALFGVVFGQPIDDWTKTEGELMEWVDEYFNKVETGGGLSEFGESFREKYAEIEAAWLWITLGDDGKRAVKAIRWGETGVILRRGIQEYNLTGEEGRVVKGVAEAEDAVAMWSGELGSVLKEKERREKITQEEVAAWGGRLAEAREAGAGLFFDFEKLAGTEKQRENKEAEEEIVLVDSRTEGKLSERETTLSEEVLAGDRLVGPVKVKDRLTNWWKQGKWRERRDLKIKTDKENKRKRWAVFLGVLFLLLLTVSLITGSIKIKADREMRAWKDFSEPIEKSLIEAQSLVKINQTGARKMVEEAKLIFETKKADFSEGKYKDEIKTLETRLSDAWTVVSGEKEVQIDEAVNIQLVRSGFEGERMSLIGGEKVMVLDGVLGTVVSVDISSKDIKVVAGKGEGSGWIDAVGDDKVYVLDSKGVSVANKTAGGVVFDLAVNKAVAMGKFGANLYVLDQGNREIYKYGATSDGFGDRIRWLKQEQSLSINPVDIAIDTDVWVLGDNGSVEKFRRGEKEQFAVSGVSEGTKAVRLAVEQDGTRLAILDATNGVVFLCSKETGGCDQQLRSEKLKTARDIEFDEKNRLLVLLALGKIGVLN